MIWLITGVNRGIGRALALKALDDGDKVIGVSRREYDSVREMSERFKSKFKFIIADLRFEKDIEKIVDSIDEKIDFLMNNAGVLFRESYPNFSQDTFLETMKVNTFAPLKLSSLLESRGKFSLEAKIVNTSSVLGSISQASSTPSYSYSISKAALNMVTKLLSSQLRMKQIVVISVHPGWVRTDMGGNAAPVLPEDSAKGIISLARRITMKDSGKFFDYMGREIEW